MASNNDYKTINVLKYSGNEMSDRDIRKFVDIVLDNFKDLSDSPSLGHNRREITRLLISPQSLSIIATYKGQIIGYLLADITSTDDLKQLMHIYYLYTSPLHRNKGIATYLLNKIQSYTKEFNIDTLSLTFDTYNKPLEKFYLNNGFVYDDNLRSHQRHDMLVKYI